MTNDIKFKTMQEASKRLIEAQDRALKPFEDELRSVQAITLLLYVDKKGGKHTSCSAQALLRDSAIPQHILVEILTDQLARASGAIEFDEQFRLEQQPDGRITGITVTNNKGKGQ